MNYKLHILTNGWEAYYDRQLRLWVGIQRDSERFAIVQDNGEEAVYGASLDDVKASTESLTDAPECDSSDFERQIVSMQDEIDRLRRIEVEYATVKKLNYFTPKHLGY